jgi:hypothetical protein
MQKSNHFEARSAPTAENEMTGLNTTSSPSTEKLTNKRNSYTIWYDPRIWEQIKSEDLSGDIEFGLYMKGEDAYAMTVYERIPIPLENLKKLALENMKEASETAKITDEKMVAVNGELLLSLRMEALIEGIPFVYRNYYASGDYGSIQFLTFTHSSLEEEYSSSIEDLLNGLHVMKSRSSQDIQ